MQELPQCNSHNPIHTRIGRVITISGLLLGLVSCGGMGDTSPVTVSGTVTGLTGTGLILQNNGADDQVVSTNGIFTFTTSLDSGTNFSVTVKTQPTGPAQTCTVNSGSGTVSGANITNVSVVCSTNTYTVSGSVNGLTGTGLVLQNNTADSININANGTFSFPSSVASGANYSVTVKTQPSGPLQTCTVSAGGSGTVTNVNVSGVTVLCSASAFTIGGKVIGIAAGKSVVLQNNGGDDVTVTANGHFNFPTKQVDSTSYNASIRTPPAGDVCASTYGWDIVRSEHVTNINVICGPRPSGSFSTAGSLINGRYVHSATLLADGRLLVAGGIAEPTFRASSSAELYDPAANTWSMAGSMATPRYNHAATLLPNGKMLVTGGYDSVTYFSSAELYDPATDRWAPAGNMSVARLYHTATLLRNGKVLVVGGTYGPDLSASAELYDPTTNTWSSAGSLGTARYLHTATLLNNGKVLVAAGATGTPALKSAELYDPATNTWSATGSLATERSNPTANLLPSGKVLLAGGSNALGVVGSAELYDPATETWSAAGNMIDPRIAHTAISGLLPTGQVLVAGGHNGTSYFASAEVYDPATNSWSTTGSLAITRAYHSATLLSNGRMLIVGGEFCMRSTEIY